MSEVHPPPTRRSVWTPKQKVLRVLWTTVARAVWIVLPPARPGLIRLFGGRAGRNCRLARSVQIAIPWNVRLGDDVEVGEHAVLYSLGEITLGDSVVIDYGAHLCAGTHDMRDSRFPLLTPPITIGRGCFVGIDAFIGPNVTLGDGCRVWPRASVYRDCDGGVELRGNPAIALPDGETGNGESTP